MPTDDTTTPATPFFIPSMGMIIRGRQFNKYQVLLPDNTIATIITRRSCRWALIGAPVEPAPEQPAWVVLSWHRSQRQAVAAWAKNLRQQVGPTDPVACGLVEIQMQGEM